MRQLNIQPLLETLLDGDQTQAVSEARKLRGDGAGHEWIVNRRVRSSDDSVGCQVYCGAVQLA